jgi:hypothetical protein
MWCKICRHQTEARSGFCRSCGTEVSQCRGTKPKKLINCPQCKQNRLSNQHGNIECGFCDWSMSVGPVPRARKEKL